MGSLPNVLDDNDDDSTVMRVN